MAVKGQLRFQVGSNCNIQDRDDNGWNQSDSGGGGKKGLGIRHIYFHEECIRQSLSRETEPIGYIRGTRKALSRLRRSHMRLQATRNMVLRSLVCDQTF